MKKLSILFLIIGLLIVGCSQKKQLETNVSAAKSNSGEKMERLDLIESDEIAIFRKAVSDSVKVPGIVNMAQPQYRFSLGEESYSLWITEDSGTIMNTKDTHTIYSLSPNSAKEVNAFVNKD